MTMSTSGSTGPSAFAIEREAAPIRRQVEARLRHAITSGQFPPGERLIERELCALLGVSRSSVREALRALVGDGLVVHIPQKGMVVARMSREEAQEVYQMRAVVEGLAARLCAEQLTKEGEAQLQAAFERLEVALAAGSLASLIAAKEQFYQILLAGSGNRTAGVVLQSLHNRIASLRVLTLSQPGRAAQSVAELRRVLQAILARDGQAACQASIEHVERAAALARGLVEDQAHEASHRRTERPRDELS